MRWQFQSEDAPGSPVRWRWQAFDLHDRSVHESQGSFDTLSDCIRDARDNGYPPADANTAPG